MKKIIAFIFIATLLASCSNSGNDKEEIQNKIKKYREEIATINDKINELEKQLAKVDDNDDNANNANMI